MFRVYIISKIKIKSLDATNLILLFKKIIVCYTGVISRLPSSKIKEIPNLYLGFFCLPTIEIPRTAFNALIIELFTQQTLLFGV